MTPEPTDHSHDDTKSAPAVYWDLIVAGALMTRLPLPHAPDAAFVDQARSAWAFPLVGLLVGGIAAAIGSVALALGLGTVISAGLILGTAMLATGAMHEDGLADTADGLWGGYTTPRRLTIMKDSHIGTYGILALIIGVGLRWAALAAALASGTSAFIVAAVLSRGMLPAIMATVPQARNSGLAHHVGKPDLMPALAAGTIGLIVAFAVTGWAALPAALAAIGVAWVLARVALAKIGGYTGDILGAVQNMAELAVLLVLIL